MSQKLMKNEDRLFKEKLNEAFEKDLLTEKQRDALLVKYNRKHDGEPLSVQNRNALRILRNSITHNNEIALIYSKNILRLELLQYLLSVVDGPQGVYCHACKEGLLVERTISSWTQDKEYELILEQKPAKVCINNSCKTTTTSIETDKKEEEILKEIEKQLQIIKTTKPEKLEPIKCPMCRSDTLEAGQTGQVYRYRQGLYHIKIKDVPLKAYCTLCHYQEIGENVNNELDTLQKILDTKTLELLEMDG